MVKPINITLTPNETRTLTGVFEIFTKCMNSMEVEVPAELKQDMASILTKIVDRLTDQMIDKAMGD